MGSFILKYQITVNSSYPPSVFYSSSHSCFLRVTNDNEAMGASLSVNPPNTPPSSIFLHPVLHHGLRREPPHCVFNGVNLTDANYFFIPFSVALLQIYKDNGSFMESCAIFLNQVSLMMLIAV